MASLFEDVRPGELISSDLMNRVFNEIELLSDRIAALETVSAPQGNAVITELVPGTGPYRIGQELRVLGRNFGFLSGNAQVFFDNELVTAFRTSLCSDQQLVFNIPDPGSIPITGRAVALKVTNQTLIPSQRTITLLPAQPLSGTIEVTWLSVNPGTPTPNNPITFRFRIKSRANLDAVYTIAPSVTGVSNPSDWNNRLQVLDGFENVISSSSISVAAGQDKVFHVRINPIPSGTASANGALSVVVSAEDVAGSSGSVFFTVGTPIEQPNPNISLTPQSTQFSPAGSGTYQQDSTQDVLSLNPSASALVEILAEFRAQGTYEVGVSLVSVNPNWTVSIHTQSTPASYVVTGDQLANPQGKHDELPKFVVAAAPTVTAGTSPNAELEFRIRQTTAGTSQRRRVRLVRN